MASKDVHYVMQLQARALDYICHSFQQALGVFWRCNPLMLDCPPVHKLFLTPVKVVTESPKCKSTFLDDFHVLSFLGATFSYSHVTYLSEERRVAPGKLRIF